MSIDLKNLKLVPFTILACVIMQVVVSFNVFGFLLPLSIVVWTVCLLSFIVVLYLYAREGKMSNYGMLWVSYLFLILLSTTLLNGTSLKLLSRIIVDCTLFMMLVSYYQHNIVYLIKCCNIVFSGIIYLNLALMIMFPNWMFAAENVFDSFLLGGNYNQMGGRLLCGIITSVLCIKFDKRWVINTIGLIVVSLITLAIVGSMTALSGIIIFTLFCLVPFARLQRIGLLSFFIFYLFFQIFVCFNGEGLHNNELARYIIIDVLGKDITFTYRTTLWELASRLFADSPIIGYGCVDRDWYVNHMTSFAIGPHTFIWGQLINGGVLLLSLLICIFIVAIRRILTCFDRMACVLTFGLCTLLFMMLMEVYPLFLVLYLLTFIYYYPLIVEQTEALKNGTSETT